MALQPQWTVLAGCFAPGAVGGWEGERRALQEASVCGGILHVICKLPVPCLWHFLVIC